MEYNINKSLNEGLESKFSARNLTRNIAGPIMVAGAMLASSLGYANNSQNAITFEETTNMLNIPCIEFQGEYFTGDLQLRWEEGIGEHFRILSADALPNYDKSSGACPKVELEEGTNNAIFDFDGRVLNNGNYSGLTANVETNIDLTDPYLDFRLKSVYTVENSTDELTNNAIEFKSTSYKPSSSIDLEKSQDFSFDKAQFPQGITGVYNPDTNSLDLEYDENLENGLYSIIVKESNNNGGFGTKREFVVDYKNSTIEFGEDLRSFSGLNFSYEHDSSIALGAFAPECVSESDPGYEVSNIYVDGKLFRTVKSQGLFQINKSDLTNSTNGSNHKIYATCALENSDIETEKTQNPISIEIKPKNCSLTEKLQDGKCVIDPTKLVVGIVSNTGSIANDGVSYSFTESQLPSIITDLTASQCEVNSESSKIDLEFRLFRPGNIKVGTFTPGGSMSISGQHLPTAGSTIEYVGQCVGVVKLDNGSEVSVSSERSTSPNSIKVSVIADEVVTPGPVVEEPTTPDPVVVEPEPENPCGSNQEEFPPGSGNCVDL